MIDRSLNYGRARIQKYLQSCGTVQSVLDIGAGHGSDLASARLAYPQATLYGVENDPKCQTELREMGVVCINANIERDRLPFNNETLDVVIINQVLEHVKEIFWILHEVSRTLKIGGHLIIGVPNLASAHNRLLLLLGLQPTSMRNNSAHLRGFTYSDVVDLLESGFPAGYQSMEIKGSNFYPFPSFVAQPLSDLFPKSSWGIFIKLKKIKAYENKFLTYPVDKMLETNFFLGEPGLNQQSKQPLDLPHEP